jgi:NAD(P)-dependent dehydrogenase (short-subunit alcohol dehydrogenase family)
MNFEGKIVFITGTNRGIGKSLVKAALDMGAKKVYATARKISSLADLNDDRVVKIELDITNAEQIRKATELATGTQILINNAGVVSPGNILDSDMDKIKYDMDVNYFSTINMMRAFVPILEKNNEARIINIVSIAIYTNFPFIAGYSASKAALYSATQAARIELAKKGIVVHAVNPGAIDTDMNKGSNMDMTSPDDVAVSILREVEAEKLDIIPDKIGRSMYSIWKEDPANLEAVASKMYHENN